MPGPLARAFGFGEYVQDTDASDAQENVAKLQQQVAEQLFRETGPLRGAGINQLNSFLQTGNLPIPLQTSLQGILTTGREGLEQQYGVARNNILSRIPSQGGQLNAQLAALEMNRASQVGRLGADVTAQYEIPLRAQLFQSALNTGMGGTSLAMGGLNAAGGQFGGVANRLSAEEMAREKMAKEMLMKIMETYGKGAGMGAGMGGG